MEVDGIVEISKRSEEIYGIKYDYYVGDVNSKFIKLYAMLSHMEKILLLKKSMFWPYTKDDGNSF